MVVPVAVGDCLFLVVGCLLSPGVGCCSWLSTVAVGVCLFLVVGCLLSPGVGCCSWLSTVAVGDCLFLVVGCLLSRQGLVVVLGCRLLLLVIVCSWL